MSASRPGRVLRALGSGALGLGVGLTVLLGTDSGRGVALGGVEALVTRAFPDVPAITAPALQARLAAGEALVLLDARSPAEFAVSHLAGAVRVSPAGPTPVVVYCSVGWRSARRARELARSSGRPVFTLEGGLFRWVHEGYPLADGRTAVHPFGWPWSWLLPLGRASRG